MAGGPQGPQHLAVQDRPPSAGLGQIAAGLGGDGGRTADGGASGPGRSADRDAALRSASHAAGPGPVGPKVRPVPRSPGPGPGPPGPVAAANPPAPQDPPAAAVASSRAGWTRRHGGASPDRSGSQRPPGAGRGWASTGRMITSEGTTRRLEPDRGGRRPAALGGPDRAHERRRPEGVEDRLQWRQPRRGRAAARPGPRRSSPARTDPTAGLPGPSRASPKCRLGTAKSTVMGPPWR